MKVKVLPAQTHQGRQKNYESNTEKGSAERTVTYIYDLTLPYFDKATYMIALPSFRSYSQVLDHRTNCSKFLLHYLTTCQVTTMKAGT